MSLKYIVKHLCDTHKDPHYVTIEVLKAKLRPIMTPWISEGFFASCAVLVEGEEDKEFLQCCAGAKTKA